MKKLGQLVSINDAYSARNLICQFYFGSNDKDEFLHEIDSVKLYFCKHSYADMQLQLLWENTHANVNLNVTVNGNSNSNAQVPALDGVSSNDRLGNVMLNQKSNKTHVVQASDSAFDVHYNAP